MKADGEWRRHYPITPHNELEQVYYRGYELHAPAWTAYYKKGKSYNDVQHFDCRKQEFSLEELEKKKKAEKREKVRTAEMSVIEPLAPHIRGSPHAGSFAFLFEGRAINAVSARADWWCNSADQAGYADQGAGGGEEEHAGRACR